MRGFPWILHGRPGSFPARVTLIAGATVAVVLLGLRFFTLYTARPEWDGYTTLARQFLDAALSADSTAVDRYSGSTGATQWARTAARHHPAEVAVWARRLFVVRGSTTSDGTAIVTFRTSTRSCYGTHLLLWVAGGPRGKVVAAHSDCLLGT